MSESGSGAPPAENGGQSDPVGVLAEENDSIELGKRIERMIEAVERPASGDRDD